ncbi:biotin/lipoyl-containing protein [Saccharicrinis sp. FJH62]|uniref:biotin/lipoyl-containing protein n=1 Tax=Saccharicrinis sp. FJH62 TaxID=3344657 RepID=UPI0035D3EC26
MKKLEFTIKGNKYSVHIKDVEDNIAHIEVNGTEYAVEINQEVKRTKTPKLVRKDVVKKPGEGTIKKTSGGSILKAPLPGSIFKILVSAGDEVKKGQNLLIMEAMKMENEIQSEKDGVIKALKVNVGDAVLQGDVLIEFE